MNAYNAVKTGLYGVVFEDGSVAEGAELVSEETGKRRVVLVFAGAHKNNAGKAGEDGLAVLNLTTDAPNQGIVSYTSSSSTLLWVADTCFSALS